MAWIEGYDPPKRLKALEGCEGKVVFLDEYCAAILHRMGKIGATECKNKMSRYTRIMPRFAWLVEKGMML